MIISVLCISVNLYKLNQTKMNTNNNLMYYLTIENIQAIASQEINRHLLPEEVDTLIKYINARVGLM